MDSVKRMKGRSLYNNLFLYSLTGLACSLFCSYPFWFSSLGSSMKHFLFIYLPYIWSSFSNPKCLFIVANVIIVFLVGESNFVGSNSSSAGDQYRDEFVERSKRLSRVSINSLREKKEETILVEESVHQVDEVKKVIEEEEEEEEKEAAEVEKDDNEIDGEEEPGLPTEELNKRVEEFIAKVNKQRWLEARSFVCLQA